MTTQRTEHLLTEHEAAALLHLAVPTLRRWRWAGRGPRFAKIGAAVRYEPAELRAYIERQTRRSTSDTGAAGEPRRTSTSDPAGEVTR